MNALPHFITCGLRVAPLVILAMCTPSYGASLPAVAPGSLVRRPVPLVLARFAGFEGRIDYSGRRTDVSNAPVIQGTATITNGGFSVEERGAHYILDADTRGVVIRSGSITARASDPLDADALINPWAIAVAALAKGDLAGVGPTAWQTRAGITVFTDSNGTSVAGIADGPAAGRLAFTFAGWSDVAGLPFPTRILRVRNGVSDASFQIERLEVTRTPSRVTRDATDAMPASGAATHIAPVASQPVALADSASAFPWRLVSTFFGFMLLAVAIVAWLRRDAFSMRLCARIAADDRGWHHVAAPAFVSADGLLKIEGNDYRVGPEFYARTVEVQHSALFLRVSAPGLSKIVVFARRLPRADPGRRMRRRTATAGLSLVETLVATAFFTVVVVAAVYPALTAVARADFVAAQKRAAIVAVSDALTDEEMACAYGTATPVGTTTSTVNGMTIVVKVTDASVAGARDIVVTASNSSGRVLAALATTVGPPVPPPGLPPGPSGPGGR